MTKPVETYVWPEKNYTDQIHDAVEGLFRQITWRPLVLSEISEQLSKKFPWLVLDTPYRKKTLNMIVRRGITKLVQLGLIVEIKSNVTTDKQWQWSQDVDKNTYKVLTSADEVAHSMEAVKRIRNRALSAEEVRKYNRENPNPQ